MENILTSDKALLIAGAIKIRSTRLYLYHAQGFANQIIFSGKRSVYYYNNYFINEDFFKKYDITSIIKNESDEQSIITVCKIGTMKYTLVSPISNDISSLDIPEYKFEDTVSIDFLMSFALDESYNPISLDALYNPTDLYDFIKITRDREGNEISRTDSKGNQIKP